MSLFIQSCSYFLWLNLNNYCIIKKSKFVWFCVIHLAWDRTYHQKTNYFLVICSYVGSHTSFQNLWHDKQPQKLKTQLNYLINDIVWQNIIKGIFLCKTFWLYARLLEERNGLSTSTLNYTYSKMIIIFTLYV